jgi:hypothetical protein
MGQNLLNVGADWIAIPLHTRKVLGSDLGSETAYPELSFSYLHSVQRSVVCHKHVRLRLAVATTHDLMINQYCSA